MNENQVNIEKPLYKFYSPQLIVLVVGVGLIINFFIIYIFSAYVTKQVDFFSFLFQNIRKNIIIMIASGLLVSLLGFGILLCLTAFFNMSPIVFCYSNRFLVYMYLQKKHEISYDDIDKINVQVFYHSYENLFKRYPRKECRVTFLNQKYDFYMSYPVEGYFDDIEITMKNKKDDSSQRCFASYKAVHDVINRIRLAKHMNTPYLPEEKS